MEDNIYRQHWDHYVKLKQRSGHYWPGDEWGTPESWDGLFNNLFVEHGVASWRNCVEIGAGSGKYTIKVLEHSPAHVLAADVSPAYQEVFRTRLTEAGLISRVSPVLLDNDSATLCRAIEAKGWKGELDGFYSIDAMVHVDLQYLIAYLVTAAVCLKPGGKLIMTLANCCSDRGFEKLIAETRNAFARIGKHSGKFEWLSPDAVRSILPRLGFDIGYLQSEWRDIFVVATLRNPLNDPKITTCIDPVR
jgi:hypothetical protein